MLTTFSRRGAWLALGGWLAMSGGSASAADRPADKILAEIKAVEMPQLDPKDRSDRQAVQEFILRRQKVMEQKATLIGELYKAYPENPELVLLLPERWQSRMMPGKMAEETKAEVEQVLAKGKNEKLVGEAAFLKVVFAFQKAGQTPNPDVLIPAVDEFTRRFPKDPRGAMMLSAVANFATDDAKKDAINKRLERDYPDSPAVKAVAAERRQREAVGKPFDIAFVDAIKGAEVSSKTLKGKVVVVDFWATWCGPCVAEMPKMKELYARYRDKGVEFVGVSLDAPKDQGGYEKLKAFVEKNKIEWPQYYEGKTPATEFATEWGIAAIPTVFAIDADGKLASTQARGRLEELIPELLEKAKKDEAKP